MVNLNCILRHFADALPTRRVIVSFEGELFLMECDSESLVGVGWYYNGVNVNDMPTSYRDHVSVIIGELVFNLTEESYTGIYSCTVMDNGTEVVKRIFMLYIAGNVVGVINPVVMSESCSSCSIC